MTESTAVERAMERRNSALEQSNAWHSELPLRYLHQQAHLTVPATDPRLAEKAITGAHSVAARILTKFEITPDDIAARLQVPAPTVEEVLGARAPLVLVDLEDGVPPQLAEEARRNAAELFRAADWGSSLRFFRCPSLADERCTRDVTGVLFGAAAGRSKGSFPVDGIVFPKVRFVHEVEWLYELLDDVERSLGLPENHIRVSFQIETAWGVLNLPQLVQAGRQRLASLILGTVDLSADILLPEHRYRHPICDWTRAMLVLAAGGVGVPAIDGMTLNFPVASASLSVRENHDLLLDRMAQNFEDARYSIDYGMAGRWVGHPLQLIATVLAFRSVYSSEFVGRELNEVREFQTAMEAGLGAVAGKHGELLDIGTDRHARQLLRRAVAWGLVSSEDAVRLNLASAGEVGSISTTGLTGD